MSQQSTARDVDGYGARVLCILAMVLSFLNPVTAETYLITDPVPIGRANLPPSCTGYGGLNTMYTPPQCYEWPGSLPTEWTVGPTIAGLEQLYNWVETNSPVKTGYSGTIAGDPPDFPATEVCVRTGNWARYLFGGYPYFNFGGDGFYDCTLTFAPGSTREAIVTTGSPLGHGGTGNPFCPPGYTYQPGYNFCLKVIAPCTTGCGHGSIPTLGGGIDPASGVNTHESIDYLSSSSLFVAQRHSSDYAEGQTLRRQPWLVASNTTNTSPDRYVSFVYTDSQSGNSLKANAKIRPDNIWTTSPTVDLFLGGRSYRFTLAGAVWTGDLHFSLNTSSAAEGTRYAITDTTAAERLVFDDNGRLLERRSSDGRVQIRYTYRTSSLSKYPADAVDCGGNSSATLQLALKCQADQFGRVIAYNSDIDGNLVKVTLPDAHAIRYSYSSGGLHTKTRFDDESGFNYHYAETGLASPVGYTDAGQQQLTGISSVSSSNAVARLISYRYDSFGLASGSERPGSVDRYSVQYLQSNPIYGSSVTDPSGSSDKWTLTWTPQGISLGSKSQQSGSGSSSSSTQNFYDGYGNLAQHNDFSGQLSCYWYDNTRALEASRLEGVTSSCPSPGADPAPVTTQRKIWTTWHSFWRLKSREAVPKLITTWVYNGQPDPTASNAILTCAPTTALVGDQPIAVLCKRVEQATSDDNGALGFSAAWVGNARTWTWTYNQWGQKLTENGPRTDVTDTSSWTYYSDTNADHMPGDLQQATNALGQVTQYPKYDRNGRVLKMIAADGAITEYLYHVRGWLTQVKVTPAGGGTAQITNITYEPTGKVKRVTQPDASWVENTYDAAQRLISQKDNLNNVVAYTLDNSGNRIKEEYRDSTASLKRNIERSYDALNRLQASVGQ